MNQHTKTPVLSQTIYRLYWNRNLQFCTANEDAIKLILLRAIERGETLTPYHINSNVAAGYDVAKFLEGEKLPLCYMLD